MSCFCDVLLAFEVIRAMVRRNWIESGVEWTDGRPRYQPQYGEELTYRFTWNEISRHERTVLNALLVSEDTK